MRFRLGIFMLGILAIPFASSAAAASSGTPVVPAVDAAVQVTSNADPARGYVEPTVAVDPLKPSTLAILQGNATSGGCSVEVSTNYGLEWKTVSTFAPKAFPKCVWSNLGSFAALTFGPDGSLNAAFSGQSYTDWHVRIFFARSTDLGQTWTTTELPKQAPDYQHGQAGASAASAVAVDPNDPNLVYVGYWTNYNNWIHQAELPMAPGTDVFVDYPARAVVAVSHDGGKTFLDPVDVHSSAQAWLTEPHIAIGNGGKVYVVYGDNIEQHHIGATWPYPSPPIGHVWLATSADQGKTYSKASAVYSRGPAKGWAWTQGAIPAVDRTTGNVYIAWEATGPGPTGGENDAAPPAVKFVRSTNAGLTWSKPVVINDVQPKVHSVCCTLEPRMSVAPNGRIDVAWYDYRNDPFYDPVAETNRMEDVYYSDSTDGGVTWSKNVRITDRSIDRSFGPDSSSYGINGPIGIASTNGAAYITWDDTRNGSVAQPAQDSYFTRVRFSSMFMPNASGSSHVLAWSLTSAALALGLVGIGALLVSRLRISDRRPSSGAGGLAQSRPTPSA